MIIFVFVLQNFWKDFVLPIVYHYCDRKKRPFYGENQESTLGSQSQSHKFGIDIVFEILGLGWDMPHIICEIQRLRLGFIF